MPSMVARIFLDEQLTIAIREYEAAEAVKSKETGWKKVKMRMIDEIALTPNADTMLDEGQQAFVLTCITMSAPYFWKLEHEEKKAEATAKRASSALLLAGYIIRCSGCAVGQQSMAGSDRSREPE
jgi:hypothetical protein